MNKTALFCDGTEGYVYPPEPKESELVTFRFRTAKDDVDRVGLVTSADTYVMEKECTQGEFDYYTFETRLGEEPFRYCFEVQSGTEKYYYGRCGISREILEYPDFPHRTGQRERLCIRYLQTAFITEISQMM